MKWKLHPGVSSRFVDVTNHRNEYFLMISAWNAIVFPGVELELS